MQFLQDALTAASAPRSGITEIRVGRGVYRPDESENAPEGTSDRNSSFMLLSNVALRGGYRGLSSGLDKGQSPDDRDIEAFETILHGDLGGDDGPDGSYLNSEENSYQIVTALNVDETAVLDGFTVMSGRSDGVSKGADPSSRDQGTAVNVYFASPTIMNCTFRNCWTKNHGTINDHGDFTTIINCTFRNNFSEKFGSGLYIHNHTASMVIGCRMIDNVALDEGGGVYSRSMHVHPLAADEKSTSRKVERRNVGERRSLVNISIFDFGPFGFAQAGMDHAMLMDCEIRGNTAHRGGGIWTADGSNVMLMNCIIADNTAELGAGMYNDNTSPVVMDCVFTGNVAELGGGGMYSDLGSPTVEGCTFLYNDAGLDVPGGGGGGGGSGGGGMWNAGGTGSIMHSNFCNNEASFGAGVYLIGGSTPVIEDCVFMNNLANEGAGLYCLGDSDAMVEGCTFLNNTVHGSSFSVGGGVSSYFSSPTVNNCLLLGNSAELGGGGMYLEGLSPVVTNCRFLGNFTTPSTEGWGGGLLNSFDVNSTVVNCVFAGNTARLGGGITNTVFTTSAIVNCTITDNTATGHGNPQNFGGGVYNHGDTLTALTNCIIWNNGPDQIGGLAPDATYCNVQGGFAGAGNINAAPQFVDADGADNDPATVEDNDYRLAASSPCVDAGDSTAVGPDVTVDVAGEPRIVDVASVADTGVPLVPGGPVVDMGAHEVQPLPLCPADISPPGGGDDVVNLADLLFVIAHWGQGSGSPADVNGDNVVNIADLLAVISAWGPC